MVRPSVSVVMVMVGDVCLFGNIFLSWSRAIRGLVVCIPRSVINKVKRRWVDVLQPVYSLVNFPQPPPSCIFTGATEMSAIFAISLCNSMCNF